jgi:hypothetical protein
MQEFRYFDLDKVASQLSRYTVSVHDYKMISPTVARVILSYTGSAPTQDEVRQQIASIFQGSAAPIAGSFRELTRAGDVKSVIGFVKASREVKPFEEAAANGKDYKVMASNLLMQTADGSMWEIKSGAMGKYLAKQSNDDLRQLIHLAQNTCAGIPKFNQIASLASVAEPKEFAAFVDLNAEEVLHGFVVASTEDKVTVIAKETGEAVEVAADQLVHIQEVSANELGDKQMAADMSDPNAVIEYWRSVYRYSPEYIQKIIDMVGMHSYA